MDTMSDATNKPSTATDYSVEIAKEREIISKATDRILKIKDTIKANIKSIDEEKKALDEKKANLKSLLSLKGQSISFFLWGKLSEIYSR
jgi:predicted  nucleic acid-binding Zn-ribbon protein